MKPLVIIFQSVISAAVAFTSQVQAQSIIRPYNAGDALRESELARREVAPAAKPQPQIPQLEEPRLSIPGNEKLFVRRIEIDAPNTLIPVDEIHAVIAPFEYRKLTLNEIFDAADKLTNLYRTYGYIVAKAYVPQQDARSGALHIKVIVGSLSRVSLENNSLVDTDVLKGVINNALSPSPLIHKDEIERAMLLVSDLPGAGTPRIAVAPGKQPETSELNFIAPEAPRVEGYILGDNYGSPYTGRLRTSGSLVVNSPLGYGDRLSLFGIVSQRADLANWRAAYGFPLGLDGLRGEISAFQTTYALGGIYKPVDATGVANGATANVSYALKRQRDESIYVSSNFTHKYLDDKVLATSTAARTINSGTVSVTRNTFGSLFDMPLITNASLSATAGNVNFPNPAERAANAAGVNTVGSYARLNLDFSSTLAIHPLVSLSTTLRAQKSLGRNLDSSEKIAVTGYFGVRSYDQGLAGDSGYIFTPELKIALPNIENYRHSLGLFTDIGAAWLEYGGYTTTQKSYTPLSDAGVGYYSNYPVTPSVALFVKAQVAHTYGSASVAPTYNQNIAGLVQIGMSATSTPTHGGLFTSAPAPDLGGSLAALLPDLPDPPAHESHAMPHAPLGVFGADMPAPGRMVFSVNPTFSNNSHSLIGRESYSPQAIVAKVPWYWSPALNVRTVPNDMFTEQQSLTLAYGLTKNTSLFLGSGFIEKHSHMMTFYGPAELYPPFSSLVPRGMSFPGTNSITDTTVAGIWRFYEDPIHQFQLNLGFSLPTATNNNPGTLLQTNGSYATTRAFYGMQSGTGTFDLLPGLVYRGVLNNWSWGLSYRGRFPLAVNPEGYAWGDLHEFNAWSGYSWLPGLTTTLRLAGTLQGSIIGNDPLIYGKVQTADPNLYGGQRAEVFGGATVSGSLMGFPAFDLALEGGVPVYQNLNGPQLAKNWQASMALRYKVGVENRGAPSPLFAAWLPTNPEWSYDAPGPRWTGFYLGVNAGANYGGNNTLNTTPGPTSVAISELLGAVPPAAQTATGLLATVSNSSLTLKNNGFLAGVEIGYDWRLSPSIVGGLAADINGVVGSSGTASQTLSAGGWPIAATGTTNAYKAFEYFGTVRGRLGYLATPGVLLYGTGGLAMAGVNMSTGVFVNETIGGVAFPVTGSSLYGDLRAGWVGGVGAEWMFAQHWSAKAEYLYYNTGTAHPIGGVPLQQTVPTLRAYTAPLPSYQFDGNIARIGLAYHFNGRQSPSVASMPGDTPLEMSSRVRAVSPDNLWTGLYAGLNAGGGQAWGSRESGFLYYADPSFGLGEIVNGTPNLFLLPSGTQKQSPAGVLGGGQIGYNVQLRKNFVVGAEFDLQGSDLKGGQRGFSGYYPSPYGVMTLFDAGLDPYLSSGLLTPLTTSSGAIALPWFGTARGRAGFLPIPSVLVFGSGGLTYGQVTTYDFAGGRAGWNLGGGVEWMFLDNWSAKAECTHLNFSSGGPSDLSFRASDGRNHPQVNIARAGLNYHFGWSPLTAVDLQE